MAFNVNEDLGSTEMKDVLPPSLQIVFLRVWEKGPGTWQRKMDSESLEKGVFVWLARETDRDHCLEEFAWAQGASY